MDYLKVNEDGLKLRLGEKDSSKMREMTINGYGDGFQILVEQKLHELIPLPDLITIKV